MCNCMVALPNKMAMSVDKWYVYVMNWQLSLKQYQMKS